MGNTEPLGGRRALRSTPKAQEASKLGFMESARRNERCGGSEPRHAPVRTCSPEMHHRGRKQQLLRREPTLPSDKPVLKNQASYFLSP